MQGNDFSRKPLQELLGLEIHGCRCGTTHRVPTREVSLRRGAMNLLPEFVDRWMPPGPLILVADGNTWSAAGEKAVRLLESAARKVSLHFVDHNNQAVHADKQTVADLVSLIERETTAGLIGVGSGTINDICKAAATATGKTLITVATAASMNGYTSAISALTVDGVKITEPCHPPVAVIADPEVLASAPQSMSAAGFGDLLSKNASTADWILSNALLGEYFCSIPVEIAEEAVATSIRQAGIIKSNKPEGLSVLIDALLRSGIAMVLAGSSSPASGGEHLISHLWDMTAHWTGRTPALHGQQTGVTTLISLAIYQKILSLEPEVIRRKDVKPEFLTVAAMESELRSVFRDIAASVMPHARAKFLDQNGLAARRQLILSRWDKIRKAVSAAVISPALSRQHLQTAGAVTNIDGLGITGEELQFAYTYARWIRNRYTVLDLAADIGMLNEWRDEILVSVR
ncbi:MAG: sn-glycerol-1-phosphate dehydrogenase [Desulfobacterales bacterium]